MKTIAVVIPCLNEEKTIGKVISDFRNELPEADIFVIDNGSTDGTADAAIEHGAHVIREDRRGKGNAVRKAFRQIEADVYVFVDGDDTLPAEEVGNLLAPVLQDTADVVVGSRLAEKAGSTFRLRNRLGNWMFRAVVNTLFRTHLTDILSGYRVMNREFVKRMQILAKGFEIETELTIMAVNRGFRITEVPVALRPRHEDTGSKIRIVGDGFKILGKILSLFCYYRPLAFFGSLGSIVIVAALLELFFLSSGSEPSILGMGLTLVGILSLSVGGILQVTTRRFRELDKRLDLLHDDIIRSENRT